MPDDALKAFDDHNGLPVSLSNEPDHLGGIYILTVLREEEPAALGVDDPLYELAQIAYVYHRPPVPAFREHRGLESKASERLIIALAALSVDHRRP